MKTGTRSDTNLVSGAAIVKLSNCRILPNAELLKLPNPRVCSDLFFVGRDH
ncbi:MAG TPA: hypothetical protein VEV41_27255 [Terriglobales bacterium]|nr:hypothetical protein [Terriglobales bacterium]